MNGILIYLKNHNSVIVSVVFAAIKTIQCDLMLLFRLDLIFVLLSVNMTCRLRKVMTDFMPLCS